MKPFLTFLFMIALMCFAHTARGQQPPPRKIILKVNLGGGPVGDFLGEDQVLETDGLHKTSTKEKMKNTDQQQVFQTQRFARDEDFVMRIPVADGIYSLTLLFAETYKKACTPGGRVFDISVGTPVSGVTKILEDFDIFQAAGCVSAYGKRFDKVPSKEGIVLHFPKKAQHPSLSGFIVEGFPVPKGDGSEYRTVGQPPQEEASPGDALPPGVPGAESSIEQANPIGAQTMGASMGIPPAPISEEAGRTEQIGADLSALPNSMTTESQQTMQMAQRPLTDISQPQTNGGLEAMGAQQL